MAGFHIAYFEAFHRNRHVNNRGGRGGRNAPKVCNIHFFDFKCKHFKHKNSQA